MQIIENMYDLRPGRVQIGFHTNLSFGIHETSSKTGQEVYDLVPDYKLKSTHTSLHLYNTRLASKSTYYINTIKTNYGKFNIRFAAVKVWNHLDESIKYLPLKTFKNEVKLNILVLLFMSFQLVVVYLFYLFIYLFSLFLLFVFFQLTN